MMTEFSTSNIHSKSVRPVSGLLCATIAIAAALFGGGPAHAQDSQAAAAPSDEELAQIGELLDKFGVTEADQASLVRAVAEGTPWDVHTGADSISTEELEIDGIAYSVDRFPDGSFQAVGFEIPKVLSEDDSSGMSPRALTGCRVTSGSGYSNAAGCQIDGIWGTIWLGATNVSYTIAQGNPDRITSTGYGFQKCVAVSCSSPALVVYESVEGSGPAYARWQSDISASYASWNVWLQLNVGGDRAWQTNS